MIKRTLLILSAAFVMWVTWDLAAPRKANLRDFDPREVGQLDAAMWRSYYERRPLRLFLQLSTLMRRQFHAPFWRSFPMAYRAAKAAFVFKDGRNREEYDRALPHLERYFSAISRLSDRPFDVAQVAEQELEWWIIRRETDQYTPADWERILAEEAGLFYGLPAERFVRHAQLRTEAMLFRDGKGDAVSEADWQRINRLLVESWTALYEALHGDD